MQRKSQGKFIVLYSGNNLGKSTQVNAVQKELEQLKIKVHALKYADYEFEPTGVLIDEYLRQGNPYKLDPIAFQTLHAANKYQYEKIINKFLESETWILAEDYIGTSYAWGIATGVNKKYLIRLNSGLLKPDLEIVLVGKPFGTGHEKGHTHEKNRKLVEKVSHLHAKLAKEFGWTKINANQEIPEVTRDILQIIKKKFKI